MKKEQVTHFFEAQNALLTNDLNLLQTDRMRANISGAGQLLGHLEKVLGGLDLWSSAYLYKTFKILVWTLTDIFVIEAVFFYVALETHLCNCDRIGQDLLSCLLDKGL